MFGCISNNIINAKVSCFVRYKALTAMDYDNFGTEIDGTRKIFYRERKDN